MLFISITTMCYLFLKLSNLFHKKQFAKYFPYFLELFVWPSLRSPYVFEICQILTYLSDWNLLFFCKINKNVYMMTIKMTSWFDSLNHCCVGDALLVNHVSKNWSLVYYTVEQTWVQHLGTENSILDMRDLGE